MIAIGIVLSIANKEKTQNNLHALEKDFMICDYGEERVNEVYTTNHRNLIIQVRTN